MSVDNPNLAPTVTSRPIVCTPGVCGSKPRLDGTRIKVQDVAIWYDRMGMSPDEIVAEWPQLSLSDVHSALAYYYARRAEIERHIKEDRELAEQIRSTQPKILDKARQRHAGNDPLPHG